MSLIHEYGERKEQKGKEEGKEEGIEVGEENIIKKLYSSGMGISEIASRLDMDVGDITRIVNSK